jgi:hypothetical protein
LIVNRLVLKLEGPKFIREPYFLKMANKYKHDYLEKVRKPTFKC